MELSRYTNLYPVSKTLRFRLIPQGKTLENFEKNKIGESDERREAEYALVKKMMDNYHKQFIDKSMNSFSFSDSMLAGYFELWSKTTKTQEDKEALDDLSLQMRTAISSQLKKQDNYKKLFSDEMVKKFLQDSAVTIEEKQALKDFESFTTYFYGFYENRKNIYTEEAKSTGLAFRLVDQNLPKYLNNVNSWHKVTEKIDGTVIDKLIKEYKKVFGDSVEKLFSLEGFNYVLSQTGIDMYNSVIGGYTINEVTKVKARRLD